MFSPAFAPEALLFLKPERGGSELFRADLSTGQLSRVVAPANGGDTEQSLSLEEKLRRERTRNLATGITAFTLLPAGGILFPQGGNILWIRSLEDVTPVVIVGKGDSGWPGGGPILDARPSPNGQRLAYVQDGELFVAPLEEGGGKLAVQLTSGAREHGWSNGLADYLAAEELDRQVGYWWSPDCRYIAYQQTDDINVPELRIVHAGAEPASSTSLESHRYPFAGAPNPVVRLGVVGVPAPAVVTGAPGGGGAPGARSPAPPSTVWLDLGRDTDIYLSRVQWAPDCGSSGHGNTLVVQLLNRCQTVVDVVAYSPSQPSGRLLLREAVEDPLGWLNVHDCLTFLPAPPADDGPLLFLWASERSGFQHLYLYSCAQPTPQQQPQQPPSTSGADAPPSPPAYSGPPKGPEPASSSPHAPVPPAAAVELCAVTAGQWVVETVSCVPLKSGASSAPVFGDNGAASILEFSVLCSGTLESPLQRHLYSVPLRITTGAAVASAVAGAPRRLTCGPGMHTVTVSSDGAWMADALSSLHGPPSLSLWRIIGGSQEGGGVETGGVSGAGGSGVVALPVQSLSEAAPGVQQLSGEPPAPLIQPPFPSSPPPASAPVSMSDFVSGVSSVLAAIVRFSGAGEYGSRSGGEGSRGAAGFRSLLHGSLPPSGPDSALEPASYARHVSALQAIARARSSGQEGAGGPRAGGAGKAAGGAPRAPAHSTGSTQQQQQSARPSRSSFTGAPSSDPQSQASASASHMGGMGQLLRGTLSSMTEAAKGVAKDVGSSLSEAVEAALSGLGAPQQQQSAAGASSSLRDRVAAPPAALMTDNLPPAPSSGVVAGVNFAVNAAFQSPSAATPVPDTLDSAPPAPGDSGSSLHQPQPSKQVGWPAQSPPPTPLTPFVSMGGHGTAAPLILKLTAADGVSPMYAAMFLPEAVVHGTGPYPTILSVYGGPHAQRVKHEWSTSSESRALSLCKLGYLVIMVDNRGSARRGAAFERSLSRRMGSVEVEDQCAAVAWLVAAGLCDPERVACYGWSFGGYMSLMLLAQRPDVFRAAVAGAPVTDWASYDTCYTERYMGLPATNEAGYATSSVLTHVPNMRGSLLLVHGLIDENVHVRNTWRLINSLIAHNKQYELLVFPNERHVPREPAGKAYMEARITSFFAAALQPQQRE